MANLGQRNGSIQAGVRPVIVISNNLNNRFSPTINVLPITSKTKNNIPVHVDIGLKEGLNQPSTVLTEQILTINTTQLIKFIGVCNKYKMMDIEKAILIQSGIISTIHEQAI